MLPFQMPGQGMSDPQPRMPGAPPPAGKGMPQGAMQPPMPGGMSGMPPPVPTATDAAAGVPAHSLHAPVSPAGPGTGMAGGLPQMPAGMPMPPMGGQDMPSMADILAPGFPKPRGTR